MSLIKLDNIQEKEPFPGLHVRFVHTDNMTLAYWRIEKGAGIPSHSHPHEQVVNQIEGEFEMTVGEETLRLKPGMVVKIDPNVPHSGTAISDCRIIDAFHPARKDYQ